MEPPVSTRQQKQAIRRQAETNRRLQSDRETVSRLICQRFLAMPEYATADTVMSYVGVRSEVLTTSFLAEVLQSSKRLVVPYCQGDDLKLFWLKDLSELAAGTLGIPEPRPEYRRQPDRAIEAAQLDLVMVPGVAFDRQGGRLGHGRGYFDRLLVHVRPDVPLIAVAFECQLFPQIPMQPHDVYMDKVVTEAAVYEGRGSGEVRGREVGRRGVE